MKQHSVLGACGLECGLCPRYHTNGPSKCPGCDGQDFKLKHPACGFVTCCVNRHGLETCAKCADWKNCDRVGRLLDSIKQSDSFISYRPLVENYARISKLGIEGFINLLSVKIKLLEHLLADYDDGRSKSYYCLACQLLPIEDIEAALQEAEGEFNQTADTAGKARLVRATINRRAGTAGIDLKLRK